MRLLALAVTVALAAAACSGSEPLEPLGEQISEQVEFESVDLPGRLWDPLFPAIDEGVPVTVRGVLRVPATEKPVPAVIIMHGCGGVGSSEASWVEDLSAAGVASLLVNSFEVRGIRNICTGEETINVATPIVDLYRAAELLDDHAYVDGSRLAVMGLSFGGRSAIWAAFTRVQDRYEGRPLAGYIAFYPSTCFIRMENEGEMTGGPLRIFHGEDDDWTPIGQCRKMVERMRNEGADAALTGYPGALHGFDNQRLEASGKGVSARAVSPRSCSFVEQDGQIIDPETGGVAGVGSPCVELGITFGYNAEARQAAHGDLIAFLAEVFDTA